MKIVCQSETFQNDMQDLVNFFDPEDAFPFSIYHSDIVLDSTLTSKIEVTANGEKKEYVKFFNIPVGLSALREKSVVKSFFKNHLYQVLSSLTKKVLPWGSLTGVRPCKFMREMVERGEIKEHIVPEVLMKEYFVSEDKAKLVYEIMKHQKCIIKNDKLVDLFINIPICPTRCNYCSFISNELCKVAGKVEAYLDCLLKELGTVKNLIAEKSYIVRTIYIGGGTPTVLTAKQLDRLLGEINYPVSEFTVECGRADTITREKLEVLKKHNVNRISINPQTFCESTLKRIGRKQTNKQIFEAYMLAMEYDFIVNMDMIAGLPGEKLGIFKRSINTLLELSPQNITVHTLTIKNGAPLKDDKSQVFERDVPKMVDYAEKVLQENGYKPYYIYRQKHQIGGLENVGYFRDGHVCIFNIDSMEDVSSIIGVGAGAISKRVYNLENRLERQPNCKFIEDYISRIDEMVEKKIKFFS